MMTQNYHLRGPPSTYNPHWSIPIFKLQRSTLAYKSQRPTLPIAFRILAPSLQANDLYPTVSKVFPYNITILKPTVQTHESVGALFTLEP